MKSHLESLLVIVIQSYLASVLYGCNMCLIFQQIPILYLNITCPLFAGIIDIPDT